VQGNEREQSGRQHGMAGRRITWFAPERPIGGGTVAMRNAAEAASSVDDTESTPVEDGPDAS
jgi:hypothetical protein